MTHAYWLSFLQITFCGDSRVNIRADVIVLAGTKSQNHSSVLKLKRKDQMCLNNCYLRRCLMEWKTVLSARSRGRSEFTQCGKNGEAVYQRVCIQY